MAKLKKFKLRIEGKIDGVEMKPDTVPISTLVEYLRDLSIVLGYSESVHLVSVEEGSATAVVNIDPADEPRILHRARSAQQGKGPRDANVAYKRMDNRLRKHDGSADLIDEEQKAEVFQFPGVRVKRETLGPISEQASVTGTLVRVGGLDETVPIWLRRGEKEVFYCEANSLIAKQLAEFYEKPIRVHGIATWFRTPEGIWKLERMRIQSFDPEPLSEEGFAATIELLRAMPGNRWAEAADPLEELRKLRHGEDVTRP